MSRVSAQYAPKTVVVKARAGDAAEIVPGSVGFVRRKGLYSRLIGWGQARRGYGRSWTHCFGIVDEHGGIVEAMGRGVEFNDISKYRDVEYIVVVPQGIGDDALQVTRFLRACVGRRYGYLEIVSLALYCLFGTERFALSTPGTFICSALQAQAQVRTGIVFSKDPNVLMPAELATCYGAPAP